MQPPVEQDQKLCHLLSVCIPHRKRPRDNVAEEKRKPKQFCVYYYFRHAKQFKPVCRNFLLAALNIKKNRLITIAKTIYDGNVPKEKRGGDRKSHKSTAKKEKVKEFISSFPATESHYNRKKSCRVYLASDLCLQKIFDMYDAKYHATEYKVSLTMFKGVFYKDFNIGFKSPACDVCGTCLNLNNAIKNQNGPQKVKLLTELPFHKLRAQQFYKLAKEDPPNSISIAFDLQQVHPLPKTPIQDAFYLRQINYYSFCCVDMLSKNPTFYTWTEDQARRGSTEIGSALLSHLRSLNLENCETLRLFCDGCAGQNKNSYIITFWLTGCAAVLCQLKIL